MLVSTPQSDLVPQNTQNNPSPREIKKAVAWSIYINPKIHINSNANASQVLEILMTNIGWADTSGQSIESIVYGIQWAMDQLPRKELSTIANTAISRWEYSQAIYNVQLYAKMLLQSL
jgi:hypothetical protein